MAEVTPPLFMDVSDVYSGDEFGLPYRDLLSEGVVAVGDLAVSQRAAGANLSVDIAKGTCWVLGDTNADRQPLYRCFNDAVKNIGISPDPSLPRKVLVVAKVTDATFTGSERKWELIAKHGTPAASPVEPTLDPSEFPLALIDVTAGDTDITNAQITDRRIRASVGGGQAQILAQAGAVAFRKVTEKDIVNTVTETDLLNDELTILANQLGTNKTGRLTLEGDYLNNSGANRTLQVKVKLGATTLFDDTVTLVFDADRRALRIVVEITNLGAANSQWLGGLFALSAATNGTSGGPALGNTAGSSGGQATDLQGIVAPLRGSATEDTTANRTLKVTVTHGAAHASLSARLKHAYLEIL